MASVHFSRFFRRKIDLFKEARRSITQRKFFIFGDEVLEARKCQLPIVGLESAIITHGMPYPNNLTTAIAIENVVRRQGAVPATIAVIDGNIHIGVSEGQLQMLAKVDPVKTLKCSRGNLSYVIANKLNGGTTVSATMLIAHMANIPIMATGGIGGVHRGAENTFDISTDLTEFGCTPVTVVCSGIKSILDIRKTLEYLETQGVPVVKIGTTNDFPAFYCTTTHDKIKVNCRVSCAKEAANLVKTQRELELCTGLLLAVPIPDKYALDPAQMESAINKALEMAKSMHITGKAVTPFLLDRLNDITGGKSLEANIALVLNNAKVAADIAVYLGIKHQDLSAASSSVHSSTHSSVQKKCPVVVGGAVFDTILQVKESETKGDDRTHAGQSWHGYGGVGRNIASALIKLGLNGVSLISVVGNDEAGRGVINSLNEAAELVEQLPDVNTARYTGIVNSEGKCCFGIGEMDAFAAITPNLIRKYQSHLEKANLIVLDGNLPLDTMTLIVDIASQLRIPVWYEPTDIRKAVKIFHVKSDWRRSLHFVSPNRNELLAICEFFNLPLPKDKSGIDIQFIKELTKQLADFIPVIISTLGPEGAMVTRRGSENEPFYDDDGNLIENGLVKSHLYPPLKLTISKTNKMINAVGCGDCLTAGVICGIYKGLDEAKCLFLGLKAASFSLQSADTVPNELSVLSSY